MSRIFISYRREDEVHLTGRIYDRLVRDLGPENVFKDVDNIPMGRDFRQVLREWIDQSDAVLVVIGGAWLTACEARSGRRRLEAEGDYVRFEIEVALARGTRVIPVLVGDTPMPAADDLPSTIRNLAFAHAARIRPDPDFHRDLDHLIHDLKTSHADRSPGPGASPTQRTRGPTSSAQAGAGAAAGPGARPEPSADAALFERLWRELGPAGAMAQLEAQLRDDDEPWLGALLRFLRRRKDPAAIPFLFHLLAHRSEVLRRRAKGLVQAFGWPEIAAAGVAAARRSGDGPGAERVGFLLEGLAAIEADPEVVALLERLVVELTGGLRTRAILLLERKRLGLQFGQIASLFREKASPYALERPLGQGLITAAYKAMHEMTGRPAVVRVLRPEFVAQPRVLAQFLDVSKRSFGYVHQNLVHMRDVQAIPDHRIYYTVRDYVDGVTLQAVLADGKRFEPAQALEILRQALEALTPVHDEGAFHGGIKPSNLFLCAGERVRIILGDPSLPLAGAADLERLSYDYRYAPPELFRGGAAPGPRADFYALGCLAYELLCGAPPLVSDNAFELIGRHGQEPIPPPSRRGCPLGPPGDAWVLRLLAKSPDRRFADLDAALAALKSLRDRPSGRVADDPRPVTILGRDSLVRYEAPESILRLTGDPGTAWKDDPAGTPPPAAPDRTTTLTEPPPPAASDRATTSTVHPAGFEEPEGSTGRARGVAPGEAFGRYLILKTLGQGGMGSVYLARDSDLDRLVALKIPHLELHSAELRARFRREARVAASLNHPNICPIFDVGEEQGMLYLTMAYLEGETLASVLKRNLLPRREAVEIVRTLADAMQAAHDRGVIHRDLKPSNVMLSPDRGPILLDFGVARLLAGDDSFLTGSGGIIGTPAYMAPEQFEGMTGPASDIYSLGCILYELFSGRVPFRGSPLQIIHDVVHREPAPLSDITPDLDARLDTICRKALAKRPEDRYPSMRALAKALGRYLDDRPVDSGNHPGPQAGAGWWDWLKGRFRPREPG